MALRKRGSHVLMWGLMTSDPHTRDRQPGAQSQQTVMLPRNSGRSSLAVGRLPPPSPRRLRDIGHLLSVRASTGTH